MTQLPHEPTNEFPLSVMVALEDFSICKHCGCLYVVRVPKQNPFHMVDAPAYPCAVRQMVAYGAEEKDRRNDV